MEKSELYNQLKSQVGFAPWTLLKAHHARGALIWVSPDLNLVEVGEAVTTDNKEKVEIWMNDGSISPFPDRLIGIKTDLKCLIAQPYVLVQE